MTDHLAHKWPAALRISEAATYCGWSVESFKKICPVHFAQTFRENCTNFKIRLTGGYLSV